jgi:sterol 24-C-methyltransferase
MAAYELIPAGENSFEKILHKGSSGTDNHFGAIMKKNHEAQKAAADDYFRHWDNKKAQDETEATRAVSCLLQHNLIHLRC